MAFSYFAPTLMTLLILSGLTVMMYLNHTEKIPATRFFALGIALLLTVTVADAVAAYCADSSLYVRYPALCVRMRTAADTISYMLRPFIILTKVFALIP